MYMILCQNEEDEKIGLGNRTWIEQDRCRDLDVALKFYAKCVLLYGEKASMLVERIEDIISSVNVSSGGISALFPCLPALAETDGVVDE